MGDEPLPTYRRSPMALELVSKSEAAADADMATSTLQLLSLEDTFAAISRLADQSKSETSCSQGHTEVCASPYLSNTCAAVFLTEQIASCVLTAALQPLVADASHVPISLGQVLLSAGDARRACFQPGSAACLAQGG